MFVLKFQNIKMIELFIFKYSSTGFMSFRLLVLELINDC